MCYELRLTNTINYLLIFQVFDYRNNEWVPIGNRFCGRQMPPVFRSSETKLKIRLRTDNDVQGDGFKVCIHHNIILQVCFFVPNVFLRQIGRVIAEEFLLKVPAK